MNYYYYHSLKYNHIIIFSKNIIQSPAISQLQTVTPAETDKKPVRLLSNQPQDIRLTTYYV